MSDSEKPKSWKEHKKIIMHKLAALCALIDRKFEPASGCLEQCAILDILGYAGRLTFLVAVIFYIWGCEDRRKEKHYQAWQVINSAQGKTGSGGRMDALQDLNGDDVSLAGVDISNATLRGINLEHANLRDANLSGAHLYEANLSRTHLYKAKLLGVYLYEADLSGADLYDTNLAEAELRLANLTGANLGRANLTNIKGWQQIKSIRNANIYGVKNPPDGFIEWAIEHSAVNIENREEWEKFISEKRLEQTKEK